MKRYYFNGTELLEISKKGIKILQTGLYLPSFFKIINITTDKKIDWKQVKDIAFRQGFKEGLEAVKGAGSLIQVQDRIS